MALTTSHSASWRFIRQRSYRFIAFGFGAGLARRAPGTWGTLVACPIMAVLLAAGLSDLLIAWLCVPLFAYGCYACGRTCRDLGVDDYGGVVWDEIVSMMLVLAFAPNTAGGWIAAFLLFRLFDIFKPWPIRWIDSRVGGGLGVMLDDVLAAVFAIVGLEMLAWLGVLTQPAGMLRLI